MLQRPPALYQLIGLNPQGDLGDFTFYRSRKGKVVIFLKAPPKCPPSDYQTIQRNRWSTIATSWSLLDQEKRDAWMNAATAAGLRIHGYDLYVWYHCNPNPPALATIARRAGTPTEALL